MQKVLGLVGLILAVTAVVWIVYSTPEGGGGGEGKLVTTRSGLQYIDVKIGKGKEAKLLDTVFVHYTGTLKDGKKFDSSVDRGEPFPFTLGKGEVIRGWDEGVAGMKTGGKRKLIIPAELAYGAQKKPGIPPNSELHFEIELLKVD